MDELFSVGGATGDPSVFLPSATAHVDDMTKNTESVWHVYIFSTVVI